MVSLEERASYQHRIESVPQLHNFYRFLNFGTTPFDAATGEIDELINGFLLALAENDRNGFEKELSKINTRNPVSPSQSPFVNVDILIFAIILGVNRYGLDSTWIKKTLAVRSDNATTTTFKNLLQHNYTDLNNLPEIILSYQLQIKSDLITNDQLNSTYKSIVSRASSFPSKSEFDNICMVTAFDAIVVRKNYAESKEAIQLKQFNGRFLKRIKIISFFINAGLLFAIVFGLFKLLQVFPSFSSLVANFAWIAGFIGISLLGSTIPKLRLKVYRETARLLGYPKDLVNKIEL